MILQSLYRYYQILSKDPESGISPPGYSAVGITFAINLDDDGTFLDLLPLLTTVITGKKSSDRPRLMLVPERMKRSNGIVPNYLCDNPSYVFGLNDDRGDTKFQGFKELHQENLSDCPSNVAHAILRFFDLYTPATLANHPAVLHNAELLQKGGNLVFRLASTGVFAHEDPEIRRVWEQTRSENNAEFKSQCLITGEVKPIARLHPDLKGIKDAQPSGATLVGFNDRAYESFNRNEGQGFNAPVSEEATFAYTTALNYLLSGNGPCRKLQMGDTTVVYWAESTNPLYSLLFSELLGQSNTPADKAEAEGETRDPQAEQLLMSVAKLLANGEPFDASALSTVLNPETKFYVLGLSPNSKRVSVRFFYMDAFTNALQKLSQHYLDLQLENDSKYEARPLLPWQIVNEVVSPRASKQAAPPPQLSGSVMRAILQGTAYPQALYIGYLNRIRIDQDDTEKHIHRVTHLRSAVIKACLLRKFRREDPFHFQEVLTMSLNKDSTIPAYLLGRLFAVIEKVQADAIGQVNASIRDRYFASACATPAPIFPVLLRMSTYYVGKAEYGRSADRRIAEILELLQVDRNPFPTRLSLDEQGLFVLGYYHQRNDFFKKTAANADETAQNQ